MLLDVRFENAVKHSTLLKTERNCFFLNIHIEYKQHKPMWQPQQLRWTSTLAIQQAAPERSVSKVWYKNESIVCNLSIFTSQTLYNLMAKHQNFYLVFNIHLAPLCGTFKP